MAAAPTVIQAVNPIPDEDDQYRIDYDFTAAACGLAPALGDVLDLSGGVVAQIITAGGVPVNGKVIDAQVQVLTDPPTAIESLIGAETADDRFDLRNGASQSGTIDGRGHDVNGDSIDLRDYMSPVSIDLSAGTSTGFTSIDQPRP